MATPGTAYRDALVGGMWAYSRKHALEGELDGLQRPNRPPVFMPKNADRNILADGPHRDAVIKRVHKSARHRWFRSMKSSQALAQSVFGNLIEHGRLDLLEDIMDGGSPVFHAPGTRIARGELEHTVKRLDERRPTSLDVLLHLSTEGYRVAVECKLAETGFGRCSRPRLKPAEREYCDGNYRAPAGTTGRCPLTGMKIAAYWKYIPGIFHWRDDVEHVPCPVMATYQLVRNVLAACVVPGGVNPKTGHAVVVYDERNPAFQTGGAGDTAYAIVRGALREPSLLRRCSWQTIARRLRTAPALEWLADAVAEKYGIA
jgi:hypothetical protein